MSSRSASLAGLATIAAALAPTLAAAEPSTRDYVVQKGDTCVSIATRELGDRAEYPRIHELNPGMGPPPHDLRPGTVLHLPIRRAEADAHLTRSRGQVQVRKPEVESWDPAQRGMDLYRAWRVHSLERASAEVTFQDTSRLALRENTLVVILGPVGPRAPLARTEAVLENGGLESRLDAASGRALVVHTPSSEAEVRAGQSLVTVDGAGTSIVANHGGAPVAVRGVDAARRARGGSVAVTAGMGSRVAKGKPPEKPRKLPAAPAWAPGPGRFLDLGAGAAIAVHWGAVPDAAKYRVELVDAAGAELSSVEVPATVTAFEAQRVAPGRYVAHVSTIDREGFESVRSSDGAVEVVAAAVTPPGAGSPSAPAAPVTDLDAPATGAPLAVAVGARIDAPAGVTCAQGDATPTASVIVAAAAPPVLRCRADAGTAFAEVPLVIAPVRVARAGDATARIGRGAPTTIHITIGSDAALGAQFVVRGSDDLLVRSTTASGDGLDVVVEPAAGGGEHGRLAIVAGDVELGGVDVAIAPAVAAAPTSVGAVTAAPASVAPRRDTAGIGAYAGYAFYRTGARDALGLGGPTAPIIGPGPALGVRGGRALTGPVGVEVDAGVVIGLFSGTSQQAVVVTGRAHAAVALLPPGAFGLEAFLGGGVDALTTTAPGAGRDASLVFDGGLRALVHAAPHTQWWVELGDAVTSDRAGGASQVLGTRAGFRTTW